MNIQELRNFLFKINNQDMTIEELRRILFELARDEETKVTYNMVNLYWSKKHE